MTTSTDPRALTLRGIEIMATGDAADFDAVVHPEATNREAVDEPPACRVPGPSGFHATALWLRAAYSDLRWEVHEVVVDGDLVVVRTTMCGRHTGPFVTYDAAGKVEQAFPPTGKTFATTQTHWFRIADGLLIEHWANRDDLGTAKQLGWVPPTPAFLFRMARATRAAKRAAGRDAR